MRRLRRYLLGLAFLSTTLSLMLVVTGGFVTTIAGVRVSARSPVPAALSAIAVLVGWLALARRPEAIREDFGAVDAWLTTRARAIVVAIALLATSVAIAFNSFSANGADASGYLSHASMLLQGRLTYSEPLASIAKWTDGEATLAPLGWRAVGGGIQVPTYAIGLPVFLAPFHAIGGAATASFVVPMTLFTAIIAIAAVADRLAGPIAAMVAAAWIATSPVALVESMQIMSDVPVTAAWLLCWWLLFQRQWLIAGCMAAIAVLIRPNLAPIVVVPALFALAANRRSALHFAIPVALASVFVGYLQWRWFGSPFRSGYGSAAEIYALGNVVPNALLYSRWLFETHGPWLFAGPLALLLAASRRAFCWLFAFAAATVVAYLVYAQFEVWTYLRFLLPALAILIIATAAVLARAHRRLPSVVRTPMLAIVVLALVTTNIAIARAHEVFRFAERSARARMVGEQLGALLPVNAVIVSGEQSGAMRYYTGRSIVRWDLMDDAAMGDAIDWLTRNGYQVWVVLDDWEEEIFRRRVPTLASQTLDYEPSVESAAGVGIRTRAWRARRILAASSNDEQRSGLRANFKDCKTNQFIPRLRSG